MRRNDARMVVEKRARVMSHYVQIDLITKGNVWRTRVVASRLQLVRCLPFCVKLEIVLYL